MPSSWKPRRRSACSTPSANPVSTRLLAAPQPAQPWQLDAWLTLLCAAHPASPLHAGLAALEHAAPPTRILAASRALLERRLAPRRSRLRSSIPTTSRDRAERAGSNTPRIAFVTFGSADYPPLLAQSPTRRSALWVAATPRCCSLPQLAIVGSRNPDGRRPRTARAVRAHLARARPDDHQRARDRHRRRKPPRRARGWRGTVAVLGGGLDVDLSARARAARRSDRAARRARLRIPARHAGAASTTFRSATASSRAVARHARRRSGAAQRLADHGRLAAEQRPRGVRDSGVDPQPARARLSSADPPGREARRGGRRHFRRAAPLLARWRRAASRCTGSAKRARDEPRQRKMPPRYWTKPMKSC